MLRRCHGSKAPEVIKKKVRFYKADPKSRSLRIRFSEPFIHNHLEDFSSVD